MKKDKKAARLIKNTINNLLIINDLCGENLGSAIFFVNSIIESKEVKDELLNYLKQNYECVDDGVHILEIKEDRLQSVATIYY